MDDSADTSPLSTEDVTFTVDRFMQFLADVGRSNACPVCPHKGEWTFHTVSKNSLQLSVHALRTSGKVGEYFPVATMECPNCGFLLHTSLIAVMKHFRSASNG